MKIEIEEYLGPMVRVVFHVRFPVDHWAFRLTDDGEIQFLGCGTTYKLDDVTRAVGITPRKNSGRNDGGFYNIECVDYDDHGVVFEFQVDVINAHLVDDVTGKKIC
jgi:hypothetical protein